MNVKIVAAKTISDQRKKISEIFVGGFYQWLKYFSKDKQKLANALEHMFNLDVFYAFMIDGEVAGVAALNNGSESTVRLSKKEFQKHLGWMRGSIAYKILKQEFEDKKYPFEMKLGMACVEFVATAPSHRSKGAASSIINTKFRLKS